MPAAMMSRSDGKSALALEPNPKPRAVSATTAKSPPAQSAGQKSGASPDSKPDAKPEQKILYQSFFKSVGTRTYAAQVKEAGNGNHFILLTEGNRDKTTGELRKTKVIIFSEDFQAFFKLVNDTADFVRRNPVPPEIAQRQQRHWQKAGAKPNRDFKRG